MTLVNESPTPTHPVDAQVLIEEARRRQRRRRMICFAVTLVVAAGAGIGYREDTSSSSHHPARVRSSSETVPSSPTTAPTPSRRGTLVHPYGLTIGANDTLFVVDTGRDQVLKYEGNAQFSLVAGTGQAGFTGDGGMATKADLRLTGFSGIAVASNGTRYIADSGNSRVRAVLPNGTIETVLGDGARGTVLAPTPARAASVGPVAGLDIGPNGDLYVAASRTIVRVTPQGMPYWVRGWVATP